MLYTWLNLIDQSKVKYYKVSSLSKNQQSNWSHLVPGTASLKLMLLSLPLKQIILQISLFCILLSVHSKSFLRVFFFLFFPRLDFSHFFLFPFPFSQKHLYLYRVATFSPEYIFFWVKQGTIISLGGSKVPGSQRFYKNIK